MAFTVRYNALYYPIISILVISLHNQLRRSEKQMSIGLILLMLFIFIGYTQYCYIKKTGVVQFSAFGGWQLAANALYGYAHSQLDSPSNVPPKFRELHTIVNKHMESLSRIPSFLRPDHNIGVYYLWDFHSPLRIFMNEHWKTDSTKPFFRRWASMSPLYSEYGRYLIEHHPGPFVKEFVWPNFVRYYAPPVGFLGYYNEGEDSVNKIAVIWFGWKNNKISNYFKDKKIRVTNFFQVGSALINLIFLLTFIAFIAVGRYKKSNPFCKKTLTLTGILWLTNLVFSVLAAPIELRYQLFPILIAFCFLSLLISALIQETKNISTISASAYTSGDNLKVNAPLA
ncbi:hypothetical protein [Dinghuibacter silviterrae]|nr:hypothetical protein [Dinghuibacter silviterrae]